MLKIFVVLECKRGNYLDILIYENGNNWQFVIFNWSYNYFASIGCHDFDDNIYTIIYLFQANNIKISYDQHRE